MNQGHDHSRLSLSGKKGLEKFPLLHFEWRQCKLSMGLVLVNTRLLIYTLEAENKRLISQMDFSL
jgi:hypothetical protein